MCEVPLPACFVSPSSEGVKSGVPPPVALLLLLGPACPLMEVEEDAVVAIAFGAVIFFGKNEEEDRREGIQVEVDVNVEPRATVRAV